VQRVLVLMNATTRVHAILRSPHETSAGVRRRVEACASQVNGLYGVPHVHGVRAVPTMRTGVLGVGGAKHLRFPASRVRRRCSSTWTTASITPIRVAQRHQIPNGQPSGRFLSHIEARRVSAPRCRSTNLISERTDS